ncbi:MAG: twin-arginine translocase subunit TatC [Clostridia bacterium]|nr:twin-arginine translocase subunit TatC [Clostridia bacterium]
MKIFGQAKKTKATGDDSMSITGHLSELRRRIAVAVVVLFASFICCFAFIREIADYVLNMGLDSGFNFVYLAPSELLTSYFKLSLIAALMITAPVILYELWLFVSPALDEKESRNGRVALVVGFLFFLIGAVFAYTVALPFMVQFLVAFNTSSYIESSISVENYLNFVTRMVAVFGVTFEMPILAFLLSSIGILKTSAMRRVRKYAILVIFIVAAIITPPDVVSQVMIALPMILLYEVSIFICARVEKRRAAREAAEEQEMEQMEEEEEEEES